ncbi:MAG TPA: iron ABC transporter permease [Amycolatopsis sp.]|nr:iron ABC transporter permease [Amycolatopsis sp.]
MTTTAAPLAPPPPPPVKAPLAARARERIRSLTPFRVVTGLVVLVFALLVLYTLGTVVFRLFFPDGGFSLAPFRLAFTQPGIGKVILNTVIIVASSGVLALVVGSLLAWISERTDARLRPIAALLPVVPFLLPPIGGAIGWTVLLSDNAGYLNVILRWLLDHVGVHLESGPFNIYSWYGMIILYTLYQIPFAFMLVSAGLSSIDPQLEEAARVSGYGKLKTLRKVTLPALKPSIGGAGLLMVWFGFSLFAVPVIIGPRSGIEVLAVRIVNLLTFSYPAQIEPAVGLASVLVLFVGAAWYFQGRILRSGRNAAVGGKGRRAAPQKLGIWRRPAQALLLLYPVLTLVLPVIAFLIVALTGYWSANVRWDNTSFKMFETVIFKNFQTQLALKTSVILALVGATIGIVAATLIALYLRRAGRIRGRFVDAVIKLPAIFSPIVVGVAFILSVGGTPLNLSGTFLILLLAYLVLFIPQGTVTADAAAAQIAPELIEAARLSGASENRILRRIQLPLMLPSLAAGWSLMFVWMVGELNASALLAGAGTQVIGFQLLDIVTSGTLGVLSALVLLLTVVNLIIIGLSALLTRSRVFTGVRTVT